MRRQIYRKWAATGKMRKQLIKRETITQHSEKKGNVWRKKKQREDKAFI